MKKSEMIRIIKQELGVREAVKTTECNLQILMAKRILRVIEAAGMLPPPTLGYGKCANCKTENKSYSWEEE